MLNKPLIQQALCRTSLLVEALAATAFLALYDFSSLSVNVCNSSRCASTSFAIHELPLLAMPFPFSHATRPSILHRSQPLRMTQREPGTAGLFIAPCATSARPCSGRSRARFHECPFLHRACLKGMRNYFGAPDVGKLRADTSPLFRAAYAAQNSRQQNKNLSRLAWRCLSARLATSRPLFGTLSLSIRHPLDVMRLRVRTCVGGQRGVRV